MKKYILPSWNFTRDYTKANCVLLSYLIYKLIFKSQMGKDDIYYTYIQIEIDIKYAVPGSAIYFML